MGWHAASLITAGVIGIGIAILHGVLTQRLMIRPFQQLAGDQVSAPIRRLMPLLLQFSTFNWLLGGIALIVAATRLGYEARLVTGVLVGSSYLFGALANLWGARRFHPGWVLYAVAVLMIAYGLVPSG